MDKCDLEIEIEKKSYLEEERPYPSEHACRLAEPGQFDKFARKNCEMKHDGKCIDVIFGIKNNKSEIQAFRYPKGTWKVDDARAHCKMHDGSFEAASEKQIENETIRKIKVGKQYRTLPIERRQIDEEKRTVDLSFSSEEPVDRWWGVEILDHSSKSVNLRRLKRGGALLIDHDMKKLVGVIEEVKIDESDRKGRAKVRFGRSDTAKEIFNDVLDGIRSNVSVGYQINEAVLEKEVKGELSTYRVMNWEPYEISLVSVPADINVGVGRNDEEGKEIEIKIPVKQERNIGVEIPRMEERKMNKCEKCKGNLDESGKCPACEAQRAIEAQVGDPNKLTGAEREKSRIRAIENLCIANRIPDNIRDAWIQAGLDLPEVSEQILRVLEERSKFQPREKPKSFVGMEAREVEQYSLVRAIRGCIEGDWKSAPLELECTKDLVKKLNKVFEPNKFYVPFEVLERPIDLRGVDSRGRRDISVAIGGGAYLVGQDQVGFIELLRNRAVVFRMGATRLTGLTGNVTIPKQTAAATAYWLASEATAIDESQQTFVQVGLSPHSAGAYTEISRQLLLQSSPGVEAIVSGDLATVVALAVDSGVLKGTGGSGQPLGIINTSNIGGFTGASISYTLALESQSDLAAANVIPIRGGYVADPAAAAILMAEMKASNTFSPLWEGNIWDGSMMGYPAMTSPQMSASTLLFGDWSQVVVGEWGILEVEVNPYANFAAGIIGIRAIYTMDCALRYAAAFTYATGVS